MREVIWAARNGWGGGEAAWGARRWDGRCGIRLLAFLFSKIRARLAADCEKFRNSLFETEVRGFEFRPRSDTTRDLIIPICLACFAASPSALTYPRRLGLARFSVA
jgi:hypothetical protein